MQVAQPVTSEAEQDTLRGGMQIFIKTLTGKTTTFDASMPKGSDTIDHAKAKVQRRDGTVGLQRPEGKLCVAGHHEESTMKCMAW